MQMVPCVALVVAAVLSGAAGDIPVPRPHKVERTNPVANPAPPPQDEITDLSGAVPVENISKLPSTAAQVQALKDKIARQQPAVGSAKKKRDILAHETFALQKRLVVAAAALSALEQEKIRLDRDMAWLTAENAKLTEIFARDRVPVSHLIAVLERLQHDMPPAMVLKSGDVLAAARGAMLVGATLPEIYGRAALLARRIEHLGKVRQALVARRADAVHNAAQLAKANVEMNRLLAQKQVQAAAADFEYGDLKQKLDQTAHEAANMQALLDKVAALRGRPASQGVVTVGAGESDAFEHGAPRSFLLRPVAGDTRPGGPDGMGGEEAPGVTYASLSGAQVVAPAESKVLFGGPYPKIGQVLILEMANGYDVVLAGLGRLDVRLGDRVLAGEPVGKMPTGEDRTSRLYFELRHNGRGMNPAPFIDPGLRKAKQT